MNLSATFEGAYDAARAAALAGVPKSTVYYWARKGILVPSVSPVQEKLWSYADLMALRTVAWLRKKKVTEDRTVGATSMKQVRMALAELSRRGLDLWPERPRSRTDCALLVDCEGTIHLSENPVQDLGGQHVHPDYLNLLAPFEGEPDSGKWGPNLVSPRDHLRIIPGKLGGQPHLEGTRLATRALYALHVRGFTTEQIARLYPDDAAVGLAEAIDLEMALAGVDPVAA